MIITIARQSGSRGHEIGKRLAAHYGIPFYDKEALFQKAKEKGVYDEMESFLSEKPLNSLLYAIVMENSEENLNHREFDALKSLITDESFVLLGRCGNLLYRSHPDCYSFFLHGNHADCVERTMKRYNLSRQQAEKQLEEVDNKRRTFQKHYTGQQWNDSRNYDMCINVDRNGAEKTLQVIESYIDMNQ